MANSTETREMTKGEKKFEELVSLLKNSEEDFKKFYDKGNNAAGTRIRKQMQLLKTLAQEVRLDVQTVKNSR